MHRVSSILVLLVVAAGLAVPASASESTIPSREGKQTYYLISRGDACGVLSIERRSRGRSTDGCGNPYYGLLSPAAEDTDRRMTHYAIDGLPFTLDTSRDITGTVTVRSYLAVGVARRDAVGLGQPVLEVTLIGTLDGQEFIIGEFTSEPYVITPVARDYRVNFHMTPQGWLHGKEIQGLLLKLRTSGSSVFHGFYPANGSTRLSLGVVPV
ncbi:MAG TPA: hypothetical protein VHJ82_03940 [Actinomycetota bacterium]|nr:hypothetical protein [Actinomycetota bacterium]